MECAEPRAFRTKISRFRSPLVSTLRSSNQLSTNDVTASALVSNPSSLPGWVSEVATVVMPRSFRMSISRVTVEVT